jgi:hypothetical protein
MRVDELYSNRVLFSSGDRNIFCVGVRAALRVSKLRSENELHPGWLAQGTSRALEISVSAVYQALCIKERLVNL